jgi:hypothetical protein
MADVAKGKATQAEIEEGLKLLAKKRERDEKIKKGEIKGYGYKKMSELTPDQQAKVRMRTKRMTLKTQLILKKAKAAGISVSEKEIDAEIAKA